MSFLLQDYDKNALAKPERELMVVILACSGFIEKYGDRIDPQSGEVNPKIAISELVEHVKESEYQLLSEPLIPLLVERASRFPTIFCEIETYQEQTFRKKSDDLNPVVSSILQLVKTTLTEVPFLEEYIFDLEAAIKNLNAAKKALYHNVFVAQMKRGSKRVLGENAGEERKINEFFPRTEKGSVLTNGQESGRIKENPGQSCMFEPAFFEDNFNFFLTVESVLEQLKAEKRREEQIKANFVGQKVTNSSSGKLQ